MRRTFSLAALACLALGAISLSFVRDGWTQLGYLAGIRLQPATPGVADVGNAHITGTMIAGLFRGDRVFASGSYARTIEGASTVNAGVGGYFSAAAQNGTGVRAEAPLYGVYGASTGTSGRGVFGLASGNGDISGVYGETDSGSGRGVSGIATATNGLNYGGWFETASDLGRGVYGRATAASGSTYGLFGEVNSGSGRGVYGRGNATTGNAYGVYGESMSSTGVAVYGTVPGGSGFNYGVYGVTDSSNGRGVFGYATATTGNGYGVQGESHSNNGRGVSGLTTAATGFSYGVYGSSLSMQGVGVYAYNGSPDGGVAVYGEANGADNAIAIHAYANATVGVAWGLYAETDSRDGPAAVQAVATSTSGASVADALLGVCDTATLGHAVYGAGDMGASGTKTFRIDHPFDPENKWLVHYSNESPEPQNEYQGIVTTDANGFASVRLPDYFQEINKDFKYQLTVIDASEDFVLAKVAREIVGNSFEIRTSRPNVKVSWEVKGTRNDLYCRLKKPTDVREKVGRQRGKYQHPELYGLGPEFGMWVRPQKPRPEK